MIRPDDPEAEQPDAEGSSFADAKLELDFPCRWSYTVIGTDEALLRQLIGEVVGDAEHTLDFSHKSKTGRYCSLRLEVVVQDDEQRIGIFGALSGHSEVRYVI